MLYLAPEPVKELEDWFLSTLRAAFPPSVYIIITSDDSTEIEAVPYDYIKIIYSGITTNVLKDYTEQYFNFKIVYSCHLPVTLLPHRRCLAMAEKGRITLWEKLPPRPAQAYPLLLRAEKPQKPIKGDCNCGPVYIQEWQAYNRLAGTLVPNADPCIGANEPGSLLPLPDDYITPLPISPDTDYLTPNPNYDPEVAIENGNNQPYNYDSNTGTWSPNPNYNSDLPIEWGNLPFITKSFIKQLNIVVRNQVPDSILWQSG